MNTYSQFITLDISAKSTYQCTVSAKQSDHATRYIVVQLTEDNVPIKPDRGCSAVFRGIRPDKKVWLNPAVINKDGTITLQLTSTILGVDGTCDAEVVLIDKNDKIISTVAFMIEVKKASFDDGAALGSNEFLALINAINKARKAESLAHKRSDDMREVIADANDLLQELKDMEVISRVVKRDIVLPAEGWRDNSENLPVDDGDGDGDDNGDGDDGNTDDSTDDGSDNNTGDNGDIDNGENNDDSGSGSDSSSGDSGSNTGDDDDSSSVRPSRWTDEDELDDIDDGDDGDDDSDNDGDVEPDDTEPGEVEPDDDGDGDTDDDDDEYDYQSEYGLYYDIAMKDVTDIAVPFCSVLPAYLSTASECGLCPTVRTMDGCVRFYAKEAPAKDMKAKLTLINASSGILGGGGEYVLPAATYDDLGGVIVGTGLSVDDEGLLTVDEEYVATVNDLVDEEEMNQEIIDRLNDSDDDTEPEPEHEGETIEASDYDELKTAISNADVGDTIVLTGDINATGQISIPATKTDLTIDLNGHNITNTTVIASVSRYSLITVRGNLTIVGDGEIKAMEDDCYAIDVQKSSNSPSTITIKGGTFIGNGCSVYAYGGDIAIKGGTFKLETQSSTYGYGLTLNCYNSNYKTGDATIAVYGGSYYKFDPSDNISEGAGTNFVADGYKVSQDGNYYVVTSK